MVVFLYICSPIDYNYELSFFFIAFVRMQKTFLSSVLCLLFGVVLVARSYAGDQASSHAKHYELPAALQGRPDKMIAHTGFTLSFNRETLCPNWVAWELTAHEAKSQGSRGNNFQPDPQLPPQQQVVHSDYTRSGYDRGHMCPAGDMKWSSTAQRDCFLMSNICPQNGKLNSGAWKKLEESCRRWAKKEGGIYVVCGPIFRTGSKARYIGKQRKIRVPDAFFKVVMSLRPQHEKAIAFVYENNDSPQNMAQKAMSVDEAERLVGMNFFHLVNDKIEDRIEATYHWEAWQ